MMTKLLLAVLLAVPAPVFAAEAARQPAVAVSTAASMAAARRMAAHCARGTLPVDSLLSDPAFRADLSFSPTEERFDLLFYAACRSYQGPADGCAPMTALGPSFAPDCRHIVAEGRLVHSVLRGDALAGCKARLAFDGKRGDPADRACAALVKAIRAGNAASACAELEALNFVERGESCADSMIYWSGVPQQCDAYKDPASRLFCRENSALAAGLRDPAKCAASSACLALAKKSPTACDAARERFSRTLCARVAEELAVERKQSAQDGERARRQELEFKAKAAKAAEEQAAAAAAAKAKADAALARSQAEYERAEAQAAAAVVRAKADSQEKAAKLAEAEAARKAKDAAAVKVKAELEALKADQALLKIRSQQKPQFHKGEAMQTESPEAAEMLKALQEGRPIPQPKPKPAPKPKKIAPVQDADSER